MGVHVKLVMSCRRVKRGRDGLDIKAGSLSM